MSDFYELRDMLVNAHMQQIESKKETNRQEIAVEEFLKKNTDRVKQWYKANPGRRPPVFYIESEDRVIWLNREQMRKKKRWEAQHARALSRQSQTQAVDPSQKINSLETNPNQRQKGAVDESEPKTSDDPGAGGSTAESSDGTVCPAVIHVPSAGTDQCGYKP